LSVKMVGPLKILITNSGRKWIGEAAHCLMLHEQLRAAGHRVWLAVRSGSELHRRAREGNLEHLALKFSSRFSPASDWRDVAALRDLIRREKIDLLHAHRGKDHWIGVAAARLCGIPVVRTRHVVTPVKAHIFNRWLYHRATAAVISVSSAAQASLGP